MKLSLIHITLLLISSWGQRPKFIHLMELKMLIFNPILEKGIYKKTLLGIRNSIKGLTYPFRVHQTQLMIKTVQLEFCSRINFIYPRLGYFYLFIIAQTFLKMSDYFIVVQHNLLGCPKIFWLSIPIGFGKTKKISTFSIFSIPLKASKFKYIP